jgi:hypothetical protein
MVRGICRLAKTALPPWLFLRHPLAEMCPQDLPSDKADMFGQALQLLP